MSSFSKKEVRSEEKDSTRFYTMEKISEPWFSLVFFGLKKVEGRLNKGRFREFKEGDLVEWYNSDFSLRKVITRITRITKYKTFEEYLKTEGISNCLPSISTIKEGLSVYYKYYSKDEEKLYGIIAIEIIKVE